MSSGNGGGIGYNISKINDLLGAIKTAHDQIANSMCTEWPTFSNTLEREWIGQDALGNEHTLAKNIHSLYESCYEATNKFISELTSLGTSWIDFQKNNVMEGGVSIGQQGQIDTVVADNKLADVKSAVKEGDPNWGTSTNMGLQNANSASLIDGALDTYVNNVYNATKGLYDNLDASEAFIGKQSQGINTYINNVGEGMAKLTTCHKTIKEKLAEMAANYSTSDEEVNTTVSGTDASSKFNYNGENLK